jgi:hypothetical protein
MFPQKVPGNGFSGFRHPLHLSLFQSSVRKEETKMEAQNVNPKGTKLFGLIGVWTGTCLVLVADHLPLNTYWPMLCRSAAPTVTMLVPTGCQMSYEVFTLLKARMVLSRMSKEIVEQNKMAAIMMANPHTTAAHHDAIRKRIEEMETQYWKMSNESFAKLAHSAFSFGF